AGIAGSAIVLGLAVAFKVRPPLWIAAVVVAVFAIFHGFAHGTELPEAANPIAYSAGFMIATGLLHMAGIGLGYLVRWSVGKWIVQATGALIALAGLAFLTGVA
ncbi:MAG: HupE/UreJ family protein, partial [Burkholderiaceae bacterium]